MIYCFYSFTQISFKYNCHKNIKSENFKIIPPVIICGNNIPRSLLRLVYNISMRMPTKRTCRDTYPRPTANTQILHDCWPKTLDSLLQFKMREPEKWQTGTFLMKSGNEWSVRLPKVQKVKCLKSEKKMETLNNNLNRKERINRYFCSINMRSVLIKR